MLVPHDKGTFRLPGISGARYGQFYFGFICPECQEKGHILNDPLKGLDRRPITGRGLINAVCTSCKNDAIVLKTSDIIPLQADKDGPPPRALPRKFPNAAKNVANPTGFNLAFLTPPLKIFLIKKTTLFYGQNNHPEPCEAERNNTVHDLFGGSPFLEDGLVWITPQNKGPKLLRFGLQISETLKATWE